MSVVKDHGLSNADKVELLTKMLDRMLSWALSNRDNPNEFVNCYTYEAGKIPPVLRDAKAVLALVRAGSESE